MTALPRLQVYLIALAESKRSFRSLAMNINRDENSVPDIPSGMNEEAARLGFHVLVISMKNNHSSAQFYAMTPIRPNIGDHIITQDGLYCLVRNVIFKIISTPAGMKLVPNIFAEEVPDQKTPLA